LDYGFDFVGVIFYSFFINSKANNLPEVTPNVHFKGFILS